MTMMYKGDAGCDFEHHRIDVEVARPEDMPEIPPATQIEGDGSTGQGVTEEAAEQSRPHQRVVLALVEDVDQQRHAEASAGEGRTNEDVDHHPDTPGVAIVDVGGRSEPEKKTHQDNRHHHGNQHATDQCRGIEQAAANRRRCSMWLSVHDDSLPASCADASSS
jgi:hypothetical protein